MPKTVPSVFPVEPTLYGVTYLEDTNTKSDPTTFELSLLDGEIPHPIIYDG